MPSTLALAELSQPRWLIILQQQGKTKTLTSALVEIHLGLSFQKTFGQRRTTGNSQVKQHLGEGEQGLADRGV